MHNYHERIVCLPLDTKHLYPSVYLYVLHTHTLTLVQVQILTYTACNSCIAQINNYQLNAALMPIASWSQTVKQAATGSMEIGDNDGIAMLNLFVGVCYLHTVCLLCSMQFFIIDHSKCT